MGDGEVEDSHNPGQSGGFTPVTNSLFWENARVPSRVLQQEQLSSRFKIRRFLTCILPKDVSEVAKQEFIV